MSIRFRLTLLYTAILIIVVGLFGSAVFFITRATLLDEVDRGLQQTAMRLREETKAFALGDVTVLSIPEEELDVFQSATSFFVILNARGDIMTMSENLAGYDKVLDPGGRQFDENLSTVVHYGRSLRVLTEPLYIEVNGQQRLIGHLQVARLLENQAVMERLRLILLMTGVAAVCLSLFLGALLTHSLLKPLDDIAAVAVQITRADDLSRRLPDTGRRDEIGRLTMVLNETLERLERLFHGRQRFLADVSHELRTPLTAIRGNLDLLRRMGEIDFEVLDVVQEEVERMTRLVGDLILLARADSGGLPIQKQPVELDSVFLDVYRQVRSLEQPVEVTLKDVDQVCVLGDGDRLKQLILNLVDNAIKYTLPGGIVTMSLSKENGLAEVVISDTGVGIPASDLPRVFDRFFRVDRARSRNRGGSGLGLSIAKWIAQAHGGEIRAESTVGVGSTFAVRLPTYSGQDSSQAAGDEVGQSAPAAVLETGR